jgi:hypothetical protein
VLIWLYNHAQEIDMGISGYPSQVESANRNLYERDLPYYNTLIAAYEKDLDTCHELQCGIEHLVRDSSGAYKTHGEVDTNTKELWNMYTERADMLSKKITKLSLERNHTSHGRG